MKAYVNDDTGVIERLVLSTDGEPDRPGTTVRVWPEGVDPICMIWPAAETGPIVDQSVRLASAKADLGALVKARREQAKDGGLLTPFGPVETDPDSRTNINGAVQMATILGAAFEIDWRMADNSFATLDHSEMIQLGLLVGQHVSACQYRKNAIDAQIEAAATVGELEAIDLEAGWP